MKKRLIPVVVAFVLIIIVLVAGYKTGLLERYTYSNEMADLNEYFEIYSADAVPIVLQDERIADQAIVADGVYYLPLDTVLTYFNDTFYYDSAEQLLLYATPTDIVRTAVGTTTYTENGTETDAGYVVALNRDDKAYVSLDFVRKYTNFSWEAFEKPLRLQIYTEWGSVKTATVKKDTKVRYQGGIKSSILTSVEKGDKVTVLETMEKWSKVKTQDAIIGYVENKRLSDAKDTEQTPVTDVVDPEYTSISREGKVNLVWHMVTNATANAKVDQLLATSKNVNVISPTWFALADNQGNLSSLADADYVNKMHAQGIQVWALVKNFDLNTEVNTTEVLSRTSSRTNLISQIISGVKAYGIDGVNLDFELVPEEAGPAYVEFIRELSVSCRKEGIVFSIDNFPPGGYNAYYDLETQGKVADYVIIMGYNEHWVGGPEYGPVASIDFVEKGITDTIASVPAEKVINALPFYSILWTLSEPTGSEAYTMTNQAEWVAQTGAQVQWDDTACQNHAAVTQNGVNYEIWLEDAQSIGVKLNVMKKYNLAGVAAWRLGQETPDIWDVITEYLNS